MGIDPYQLRDTKGNWVMVPLVVAKANAYGALITLNRESKT